MARVMHRRTIFFACAVVALGGVGIAAVLPGVSLAVPVLAPLPLYFVLGPIAFVAFLPCFFFAWWVKTR